jgi:hypothetical protein
MKTLNSFYLCSNLPKPAACSGSLIPSRVLFYPENEKPTLMQQQQQQQQQQQPNGENAFF